MPVNTAKSKTNVMGEKEFSLFCLVSLTPNTGQRQMTQHLSHEQCATPGFSSASTILMEMSPQNSAMENKEYTTGQ